MNDFKVGDNVWCISFGFESNDPQDINIDCLLVKHFDDAIHYSNFDCYYKSRRESLEALAKRLNELLKEG